MKILAVYLIAYPLYWLGHWVSRPMYWWDAFAWLYPVYNRLMCWSSAIEEWAGTSIVWVYTDHDEHEDAGV